MRKTIRWRISDWTNPIMSLRGISIISTIAFSFLFVTARGYGYAEDAPRPQQGYSYPPQPSYNTYSPPPPPPPPRYETYPAITYQELNASYHCGVIPDTNYELYRSSSDSYAVADVVPYGKFPWIVLILFYNNVVCQGTLIHYNLILTSAHCIAEYKSLEDYEIRVGDWDLLTDYNEYEAYADRELRICSRHSLTHCSPKKGYYSGGRGGYNYQQIQSSYSQDSSDLILIKGDFEPSDKFPHVKPICLPKTYTAPSYYGGGQNQYTPDAVCWVAGWYGSEITTLRNHPGPEKAGYGGYSSYGQGPSYYQDYYKGYDSSMIQKRAKVKQVACPSSSYGSSYSYSSSYGNSYSYSSSYDSSSTDVCFIGVDGYDACVAEQGAAVFCIVQENQGYGDYDSGYNNQDYSAGSTYESVDASYEIPVMSSLHPEYDHEKASSYYAKPQIKAASSPPKPHRYRAVLYAVVQKPAKCRKGYDSYGYAYSRKSRPLVATRVDYEIVSGIQNQFWTHGYDKSCPVTKAKYKAPPINNSYYSPKKSYKNAYYFGSYYNAPNGNYGYSKRPMFFSIYY